MAGALLQQRIELGAALGETEEQREHEAAQQQPVRGCDADADGAGQQAQHEAGGDDEDVEDHHVLEAGAVGRVEQQIGDEDPRRGAGDE